MQAADEGAGRHLLHDVGDGRVGVIGRGHVVQREEHARDDLREKQEQEAGTEDVREARAAGNRLVQCLVQQPADAGTPIEPVAQATHHASTSRVGTSWRKY